MRSARSQHTHNRGSVFSFFSVKPLFWSNPILLVSQCLSYFPSRGLRNIINSKGMVKKKKRRELRNSRFQVHVRREKSWRWRRVWKKKGQKVEQRVRSKKRSRGFVTARLKHADYKILFEKYALIYVCHPQRHSQRHQGTARHGERRLQEIRASEQTGKQTREEESAPRCKCGEISGAERLSVFIG